MLLKKAGFRLYVNCMQIKFRLNMYRYRKDGISVLAVVDKRRKKNNGLYPVKIEVVYRRIQKYYPTSQDVSLDEWDKLCSARRRTQKLASIENSFYLVRNAVEMLAEKGMFSFRLLNLRLGKEEDTVNRIFESKMKSLMDSGRINSYYRYRSTLRALEDFAGKHIPLDSITPSWLHKCEDKWMKSGKRPTTVNIYMKTLQSVVNQATEDGLTKDGFNPFCKNGYRIPPSSSRKKALAKTNINAIRNWKGNPKVEYWRDLWMFSYLCNGINFRDMLFLRYGNISEGEISFIRSKTEHMLGESRIIHAPLTTLMLEIMERSGNGKEGDADTFIFRHAKGHESPMEVAALVRKAIASCNSALKIIANDLGIPSFSTYSARHSFATVMKRSGVDILYISESLGHSSVTMTENYLSGYDKEERKEYSQLLL